MKYIHLKKYFSVAIVAIILGAALSGCNYAPHVHSSPGDYPGSESKAENHH